MIKEADDVAAMQVRSTNCCSMVKGRVKGYCEATRVVTRGTAGERALFDSGPCDSYPFSDCGGGG